MHDPTLLPDLALQAQSAGDAPPEAAGSALDALAGAGGATLRWFSENGVDGIGLVLIGLFAALGAWRGLWWQTIRLAGLLVAVLAARALSPQVGERITSHWSSVDPLIVGGVSWLLVFLAALTAAVLLGRLGKGLIDALQLSLVDRFGGLLAGVATGALLHAAVTAVLLQLAPLDWNRAHIAGTRSAALVELLGDRAEVLFDAPTALALEPRRRAQDLAGE